MRITANPSASFARDDSAAKALTADYEGNRIDMIIQPLDSNISDSFERLLAISWGQNWPNDLANEIVRWRYRQRPPGHKTWVACVEGECVAMLDSQVRPYLLFGNQVMVRETADWYCLPEYRKFGLGLHVLRKLKYDPEPVLVVGGSLMTRQILPKLGWHALHPVHSYVLPVTARGLVANALRQRWPRREALARSVWRQVPFRAPKLLPPPPGRTEVQRLSADDWQELPAHAGSDLVNLLQREHWAWLASMPHELARPSLLLFRLDGEVVGSCLVQLEPAATGSDGRIVHLQVAHNNTSLVAWVLSTAAGILAARGAAFIRCFVSTPEKIAAAEAAGFIYSQEMPCYWWHRPGLRVPTGVDVDYLRGDDAQPLAAMRGRRLDPRQPYANMAADPDEALATLPRLRSLWARSRA